MENGTVENPINKIFTETVKIDKPIDAINFLE
jgi:hypothetical protein